MDKTPTTGSPGLIWSNSKPTKPDVFTRQDFVEWYQNVHIPDVLKTRAVGSAVRYECVDGNEESFHLALYYADEIDNLQDKVKTVPHHHDSVPGSHDVFDYAFFDTRFYKLIQLYEPEHPKSGQPNLMLSAEMTPADAQEFDDWYRQEHIQDGSKIRGWRRTERYELINALRAPDAPRFLTLFFLDGDAIPVDELQKAASSEWTQKVVGKMQQFRSVAFKAPT